MKDAVDMLINGSLMMWSENKRRNCIVKYHTIIMLFILSFPILTTADDLKLEKRLLGLPVEPQEVYITNGKAFFSPSVNFKIILSDTAQSADYTLPEEIKTWYNAHKIKVDIQNYSKWDKKGPAIIAGLYDVFFPVLKNVPELQVLNNFKKTSQEGYILFADTTQIVVLGTDERGVMYGLQTVLEMLKKQGKFPAMVIRDWPAFPIRAAYMWKQEPDSRYKELARYRYNMIIRSGDIFYKLAQPQAREIVEKWMALCRKYHMTAVPEINLMGHAQSILAMEPRCAAAFTALEKVVLPTNSWKKLLCKNVVELPNCPIIVKSCDGKIIYQKNMDYAIRPGETKYRYNASNAPWQIQRISSGRIPENTPVKITYAYVAPESESYCPSEPMVRQIATKAIKETMDFVKPTYIHLGHDEVRVLGLDPRDRARNLSNAELLADDITFFHDYVKKISPDCKVMIWSDLLALHQHAFGLQVQAAIDLIPKDIILCQWRYMPGELDWITANMQYTTQKGFNVVGTVWDKNQDAWEWLKVMYEKNRWAGYADGIILGAWPGVADPWAAMAETGKYAWSDTPPFPPLPNQRKMKISIATPPLKANRISRLLPYNETFDNLDDYALPDGWQWSYTPNGVSSKRYYGKAGKSFEVSGDRMVGRGARMYLDDTYCYGYLSVEQEIWVDSASAGNTGAMSISIHGPWFSERVLLAVDPATHKLLFKDATGLNSLLPDHKFPFDQWANLKIIVNITAKTWDCYLNNQLIIKNVRFILNESSLTGINWDSSTDGKSYNGMWIDNIKIEFSEFPIKVDVR